MLKLKIPPVVVFLIFSGLMWLTSTINPLTSLKFPPHKWLFAIILFIGAAIGILGVMEFARKSTTVNPHKPQNTSVLVDSGIYSISRNPMYAGLLVALGSTIFFFGDVLPTLFLPLFIGYITKYQIKPEEEIMRHKFGGDFEGYMNNVRRWL